VGDWAIAVGNPLGLDNTVTLGIVSTLKRSSSSVGIPGKRLEFIQTDAAINPATLVALSSTSNGDVIGINTAIRADAMGIGFAIPINKAKEIKDRLARGESIAHPYIGVQIADLTPETGPT
jgi:S1-C subfamily serine protease